MPFDRGSCFSGSEEWHGTGSQASVNEPRREHRRYGRHALRRTGGTTDGAVVNHGDRGQALPRFPRTTDQPVSLHAAWASRGPDCDGRLTGNSAGVEVADRVGNVFEVEGSVDDRHDGAGGEVAARRSRIV